MSDMYQAVREGDSMVMTGPMCPHTDEPHKVIMAGSTIRHTVCGDCKKTVGHFCPDWDYMFVTPGSVENDICRC